MCEQFYNTANIFDPRFWLSEGHDTRMWTCREIGNLKLEIYPFYIKKYVKNVFTIYNGKIGYKKGLMTFKNHKYFFFENCSLENTNYKNVIRWRWLLLYVHCDIA